MPKRLDCGRILIEGARLPPFGFDIAEISSSSNDYVSFCQEDLSWHDSDRGHSVSPLRVRHSGAKPRSLEVPRRESRSEINLPAHAESSVVEAVETSAELGVPISQKPPFPSERGPATPYRCPHFHSYQFPLSRDVARRTHFSSTNIFYFY